jgi:hypothetical protein
MPHSPHCHFPSRLIVPETTFTILLPIPTSLKSHPPFPDQRPCEGPYSPSALDGLIQKARSLPRHINNPTHKSLATFIRARISPLYKSRGLEGCESVCSELIYLSEVKLERELDGGRKKRVRMCTGSSDIH